jgi:cell division septum initiation protein DivIVA
MYAKNNELLINKYNIIKKNYEKIQEENENMKKEIYELENMIQSLRQ